MEESLVDAIEEGKIVRVTKDYARKEGLMILRSIDPVKKEDPVQGWQKKYGKKEEERRLFDDFRKPLHWRNNQVLVELIDNFHWELLKARKAKNMMRKQAAAGIGCSENDLKILESGLLPTNDFVLINKVQKYYGINLRKDKQDFTNDARKMVSAQVQQSRREERKEIRKPEAREERMSERKEEKGEAESIIGDDIELADELDEVKE